MVIIWEIRILRGTMLQFLQKIIDIMGVKAKLEINLRVKIKAKIKVIVKVDIKIVKVKVKMSNARSIPLRRSIPFFNVVKA